MIEGGSDRRWVFEEDAAKDAFEQRLAASVERSAWVVMGNPFHLAVVTPDGNRCAGMQRLQTTYAERCGKPSWPNE